MWNRLSQLVVQFLLDAIAKTDEKKKGSIFGFRKMFLLYKNGVSYHDLVGTL